MAASAITPDHHDGGVRHRPRSSPYAVRGGVKVARSAVVLPARRRGGAWEVLMTEAEVVNWLKSSFTERRLVPMRYGGEWKPPGGNIEPGETPRAAAARELEEEVLRFTAKVKRVPEAAVLRGFAVRQTRPIRSTSNLIYYYVALEDENPWLKDIDVAEVNASLRAARRAFKGLLTSGAFDAFTHPEKEAAAPEVHSLAWLPVAAAAASALSTVRPGAWAGAFQEREYKRWGLRRSRDPMVLTGMVLQALGAATPAALRQGLLDGNAAMEAAAARAQWVHEGMTEAEVERVVAGRAAPHALPRPRL